MAEPSPAYAARARQARERAAQERERQEIRDLAAQRAADRQAEQDRLAAEREAGKDDPTSPYWSPSATF